MPAIDTTSPFALPAEYRHQGIEEPEPAMARTMKAHEVLNRIREQLAQRVIQANPTPACPPSLNLPDRIHIAIWERFAAAGLDVSLIPTTNSIVVQCCIGGRRYMIPHCIAWARMMDIVDETIVEMLGGVDPEEQEQLAWNAYLNRLHEMA
jgi:hypothetical protein